MNSPRTDLISTRAVQPLLSSLAEVGVTPSAVLRAAQLELAEIDAGDAHIPRAKLYELFELALDLSGDPAFAMHSLERAPGGSFGPLSSPLAHAADLRSALQALQQFRSLLGEPPTFLIDEQEGEVIIRCQPLTDQSARVRRFMSEVVLTGLYVLLGRFRCTDAVTFIGFDYEAPAHEQEYTRIFEGRAQFLQPYTGLRFAAASLDARAPAPAVHDTLRASATRRTGRMQSGLPWSVRVHESLVWQQPPRDLSMTYVAQRLGISVRSLRRYLNAEGKSYAELMREGQAAIAKRCLRELGHTIQQTAAELGFDDETSFHRAFKRWTGLTPSAFRKQTSEPIQEHAATAE